MANPSTIEKNRALILNGNMFRILLLISMPVALSNLVTEVFSLFDMYFSSNIGKTEMAASAFIGPITSVITAVSLGIGVAATILVAKCIAKREYEDGKKVFGQMVTVTIIAAAILVLISLFFTDSILKAGGAKGDLLAKASVYFKVIALSMPLKFFNDVYMGKERAIGNNRHIMIINISSIVIKFILSYVFVMVFQFGIIGLGYSSFIATTYVFVIGFYKSFIKKNELKISMKHLAISGKLLLTILLCAIPIIIEKSTQSFGNVIINRYAANLGEDILSAYGVTNRINSIIFSFSSGFGAALITVVSQNLVVGNLSRVNEAKKKGIIMSLGIVSALLVIIISLSSQIASIYSWDKGIFNVVLHNHIVTAMQIYTISAIPWTMMHIYFGIFQGYKKTEYTLIVSLARLWLFRVLLVGLLIRFTNMGAYAIWYGMLISNILAMFTSFFIFKLDKKFKIVKEKQPCIKR